MLPKKIAVIGFGNTLRRDDGIGIIILESLLKFYKRPDIDYLNFGSASFDLLHRLKTYDAVLLIDAINAGFDSAELRISESKDIEYKPDNFAGSTHEVNLKSIFELCRDLGIKAKIYVAGIQVEDTSFGEGLSETLKRKKGDIVKEIIAFINKTFP